MESHDWKSEADKQEALAHLRRQMESCLQTIDVTGTFAMSIGGMCRDASEDEALGFVMLELMKLNARLHLNNPMTEDDIEFIADDIIRDYKMLTIGDIALVMDNICRGRYGQFYERLNASKILPCFQQYLEERLSAGEAHSLRQHELTKRKAPDLTGLPYGEVVKAFEDRARQVKEEQQQHRARQRAIDTNNATAMRMFYQEGGAE